MPTPIPIARSELCPVCEMVATFAGEDDAELRAASYLKDWVDMGMLVAPKG